MSENMFMRALSMMSGNANDIIKTRTGLSNSSTDMEVLDYIVSELCLCLDASKMAFHGCYTLNKIINENVGSSIPRGTCDVDFSIAEAGYYCEIRSVLDKIGSSLVSDGLFDSYEVTANASRDHSGGIELRRDTSSKSKKLGVDVGIRDTSHGLIPISILGFDTYRFSVERMLADKISAIHSIKGLRRSKDLYDFYIITNCFDVDIPTLKNEINSDCSIDWSMNPLNQEMILKYQHAYSKLQVRRNNTIISPNAAGCKFEDVMGRLNMFMLEIDNNCRWICKLGTFEYR